ncbi:uncharacterized protein LOC126894989 isoform X6 [Daktulosphaira vitifoliae]|uniref:uncharacterized protein LOC126894989 isoform X6 n=1 Tax=Daktulosphaira vitifoliae TaxID=58002 RepID=UPI0021AB0A20|nr:uncharacterized protein LOC126894989 isoform X6 [Daktulosphaira vitifoliae]
MCLITLPIFSTEMSFSNEETNNYDSDQSDGSCEEIFFSNEDEESVEYEIFDPSNEINYPMSFTIAHSISQKYDLHSDDMGRITIKKMIDIAEEFNADPIRYQKFIAGNIISDNAYVAVETLFVTIFKALKKFENKFQEDLFIGDINKNGTVEKDYAENIIFNNELFTRNFKDDFLKSLLEKYTNEQNQFKYKEMIKHFYDDIGDIKYVIWTFDKEEDDYVKKYSSNTHDDTHDHKLFLFGFNV